MDKFVVIRIEAGKADTLVQYLLNTTDNTLKELLQGMTVGTGEDVYYGVQTLAEDMGQVLWISKKEDDYAFAE
jgi:hypothetical protein